MQKFSTTRDNVKSYIPLVTLLVHIIAYSAGQYWMIVILAVWLSLASFFLEFGSQSMGKWRRIFLKKRFRHTDEALKVYLLTQITIIQSLAFLLCMV